MAFVTRFSSNTSRFSRLTTLSRRFKVDRTHHLAEISDLKVFHVYQEGQRGSQGSGVFSGDSVHEVAKRMQDENQIVLDLSHEQAFRRGHIPGALNLPVEKLDFTRHVDMHEGLTKSELVEGLKQLGVRNSSKLILYDNSGLLASRLWFVLTYFGFSNVRILDGGWRGYLKAGLPVSEQSANPVPTPTLELGEKQTQLLTKPSQFMIEAQNAVAANPPTASAQLVDARQADEFHGYNVPGSINVPRSIFVQEGVWTPTERVQKDLDRLGVHTGKPIIVFSSQGLSSSVALLGLKMAGLPHVSLYDMGVENYAKNFDDRLSFDAEDHLSR